MHKSRSAARSTLSLLRAPPSTVSRLPVASTSTVATARTLLTSAASPAPRVAAATSTGRSASIAAVRRGFATVTDHPVSPIAEESAEEEIERAEDDVDVCIVGGGPAGLCAAIRLKQLEAEQGREIRVVVLEKGGEVGSHILSGAVIEPRALNELFPDFANMPNPPPMGQPATSDSMRFLTENGSFPLPHPPQMSNDGNYILSLSRLTAWLGEQAEELGVEVYAGFAGSSLVLSDDGKSVKGVRTGDVGLDRQGKRKDSFEPGMQFNAKCVLIAEGAHGSLSQIVQKHFQLRANCDPQTYGLGIKEVWKVAPEKHEAGKVTHTLGWPLDMKTYGGSWCYHMEGGLVSLGLVVGLDYENPYLSPYREFQRMKHHPLFADLLEGGECIAYGARVLNEGGLQSIPKLHFPGGALLGCSAGFLNVPKIKGTHNAMKSGMMAAETAYNALHPDKEVEIEKNSLDQPLEGSAREAVDMSPYETAFKESWVYKELNEVRNLRPSFHNPLGLWGGMAYSGLDSMFLKGRTPWTLRNTWEDHAATKKASECQPIDYPAPDGKLSFDILTSVSLTGTNHAEDQPVHLRLPKDEGARARHVETNVDEYAGLLGRACPAAVYEYQDAEGGAADASGKKFVINSQNCIHCKTCSIKTPTQDITWCVPEGGGGPKYNIT